jgi:hypothetical protein
MLDQASDHVGGKCTFAHVGERLGVDDVIVVAGAQQREEVEAALGAGGGKGSSALPRLRPLTLAPSRPAAD